MSTTRFACGTPLLRALGACALLAAPLRAEARVTRLEIARTESPTFEGTSFGEAGAYEKIVGRAFGEVDPVDPRNAVITDIQLAPRNAQGKVEYSTDFVLLRPLDSAKGNRRLFYELSNRGSSRVLASLNSAASGGNDPSAAADAGNGFLMRQGYAVLSSGWDTSVRRGGQQLSTSVPVAVRADGTPIVGPALQEFVFNRAGVQTGGLSYPAASLDPASASLTVRTHFTDPRTPVADTGWQFVDRGSIRLLPEGSAFEPGRIYEFSYSATEPRVAGLGFAAVRDLAAFLQHGEKDDAGTANPLAGAVDLVYGFGVSQPARFLRDFVDLGFNADEQGRKVFAGLLNFLAGGSGGFFNFRFAQPGNTQRQHIGRSLPERSFPFSDSALFDPVTRRRDGRLVRCSATDSCPRIFEVNSANEYWVKGGSLLHTDTRGRDQAAPPDARYFLLSSRPHAGGGGRGICQQPRNPLRPAPALRALLVALDDWVSGRSQPPASRVPTRAAGTLVPSLPQRGVGFPAIPGVTYNGLMTTGDRVDFGPQFENGILTRLPARQQGSPYPVFVPKTDADGNDLAGIRLPDVDVPTATFTGWGLRQAELGGDDLCDASGQAIPFARTRAERIASGDPRLSIEERYPTHEAFVEQVRQSAQRLQGERFLLAEDVERIVQAAEASPVARPDAPPGASMEPEPAPAEDPTDASRPRP